MADQLPPLSTGDTTEARKRRGRPPVLTEALTNQVAQLVAAGNYAEVAAASVGISRSTLFLWLREGARIRTKLEAFDTDEAYDQAWDALTPHEQAQADFSVAIEKANAEWETVAVLRVNKAGADGAWQADMTRLERRKPKQWGRREAVEVSGQLDGVRIEADNPQAAVTASKALQDARASELACDLVQHLAGETPTEGDDDGQHDTATDE